jgi:3-hydroxymyristoyl/3-hydroxydecanoyl-(acyl carrier protein) dehydratase
MGTVTIFSDHPCFPGHFPAQPVVPGVLLLEAGMALIKRADVQVHSVKFLRPVIPDQQVQFILRHTEDALRLTGLCEGQLVLRAILKVRSGATDL